jgi:hypothetical protein
VGLAHSVYEGGPVFLKLLDCCLINRQCLQAVRSAAEVWAEVQGKNAAPVTVIPALVALEHGDG